MEGNHQNIETLWSDKLTWLANQIFTAFSQECTGLRFYILDCDCIDCERFFRKGNIDPQICIYRDADDGPCEVCMLQEKAWKDRVIAETVVYNTQIQIE